MDIKFKKGDTVEYISSNGSQKRRIFLSKHGADFYNINANLLEDKVKSCRVVILEKKYYK